MPRKKKSETAPVEGNTVRKEPDVSVETKLERSQKPRAKKPVKSEPVLTTLVQVGSAEFDITDIALKAYKAYKSVHKRKAVTDFRVYVKPEENAAYFTVNGEAVPDNKINLT